MHCIVSNIYSCSHTVTVLKIQTLVAGHIRSGQLRSAVPDQTGLKQSDQGLLCLLF